MLNLLRNLFQSILLVVLCCFLGLNALQASPQVTNNLGNPNLFIQPTLFGPTEFRVGLGSLALSDLADVNAAINNNFISEYNGINGINLSVSRGSDLTGGASTCDATNIESIIDNPPFSHMVTICTPDAFSSIGLGNSVLGATVTTIVGNLITGSLILIRDGSNLTTLTQVMRHEGGHAVGLDHTSLFTTPDPPALFPLITANSSALEDDDLFSLQTIYADDPGDPTSLFANGACFSGTVSNLDGEPVSGAIIIAEDVNNPVNSEVVSTISGAGFNQSGDLNGPGEYTLCGPAGEISHLRLNLCDIFIPEFSTDIECGSDTISSVQAVGQGLTMLRGVVLPYTANGTIYAYNSAGTATMGPADSVFVLGSDVSASSGTFNEGFDFEVDASVLPGNPNFNFGSDFLFGDLGCQASHQQNGVMEISGLFLVILASWAWLQRRRLNLH